MVPAAASEFMMQIGKQGTPTSVLSEGVPLQEGPATGSPEETSPSVLPCTDGAPVECVNKKNL